MIKSILSAAAVIFTLTPSAIAGPAMAYDSTSTYYGQFSCMQRAHSKLYSLGVNRITGGNSTIWGHFEDNTVGIWCRGNEVIVMASGPNASELRREVIRAF